MSRGSGDGSPQRPRIQQPSIGSDGSDGSDDSAARRRASARSARASYTSSASSASGSPAAGRKKLSMAEFHKVEGPSETETSSFRAKVAAVLRSDLSVNILTAIILTDTVCTLIATDARAMGYPPPLYVSIIGESCLGIYTLELVVGCWVDGLQHFKKPEILFDVFTVLCGYLHAIFQLFEGVFPGELSFLKDLRLLRVIRVLRVARILQKSRSLRELQKLVAMMATCLKALAWSFLFCFGFMTLWAMLMVEFVHPLILQMHEQGRAFQDCSECLAATSSVMRANLLLFKTVIAGDSWGQVAVPVIEYSPATAIIFCGSLMTLVFGVLNMIVAVIVDSFAESRQRDVLHLAEELEHDDLNDTKYLERIFNRLDVTGTGDLTLEELVKGAKTDPEFQSRLRVMDIDQADLEQLFEMIDADGSGSIEKNEFIRPLSRWINESKTAPRFVKYNMERALHQQEEILKQNHQQFRILQARLDDLYEYLNPEGSNILGAPIPYLQDGDKSCLSSPNLPASLPWLEGLEVHQEPGIEQPKEARAGGPGSPKLLSEKRRSQLSLGASKPESTAEQLGEGTASLGNPDFLQSSQRMKRPSRWFRPSVREHAEAKLSQSDQTMSLKHI